LYRLFKDKVDQAPEKVGRKRAISEQVKQQAKNYRTESFRVMSRMMQESQRASSINSKPENNLKSHNLNSTMVYSLNPAKS
jgi:hypothetical protein